MYSCAEWNVTCRPNYLHSQTTNDSKAKWKFSTFYSQCMVLLFRGPPWTKLWGKHNLKINSVSFFFSFFFCHFHLKFVEHEWWWLWKYPLNIESVAKINEGCVLPGQWPSVSIRSINNRHRPFLSTHLVSNSLLLTQHLQATLYTQSSIWTKRETGEKEPARNEVIWNRKFVFSTLPATSIPSIGNCSLLVRSQVWKWGGAATQSANSSPMPATPSVGSTFKACPCTVCTGWTC